MTTKDTSDVRLTALFAVRFPSDISGLDDEPFNGDREKWLAWALKEEGPELTAINSLCDPEDVEYYGWLDEAAGGRMKPDVSKVMAASRPLVEVLRAYESWEATVIMERESWHGPLPCLTQSQFDALLELAMLRNAALAAIDEEKAGKL